MVAKKLFDLMGTDGTVNECRCKRFRCQRLALGAGFGQDGNNEAQMRRLGTKPWQHLSAVCTLLLVCCVTNGPVWAPSDVGKSTVN